MKARAAIEIGKLMAGVLVESFLLILLHYGADLGSQKSWGLSLRS